MSIRIGIGIDNAVYGSFSAQYNAVLTEARTQGYTLPSAAQQAKQNTLLSTLISSGVWAKLDLILVFANDGSKEFGCINWKNPTGAKASLVASPTFTTNAGFTGNGTSSYIDTNYSPVGAGNYLQNNASRYAYLKTAIANKIIDGVDLSGANSMTTFAGVVNRINQSGANTAGTIDLSGVGMKSIHRTSSTVVTGFNDTTQTNTTATSTGYSNMNQFVLRSNAVYSNHQVSFYAMGASLVSENSALVSAFATYINSI